MTEEEAKAIGFLPNRWGECPELAKGKRVAVIFANGQRSDPAPVSTTTPPGWAADGKGACNWQLTGHPFDIAFYRVL